MKILFTALIISLMLFTFNANAGGYAGGYAGIYNQSLISTQSETGVETANEMPIATIVIGSEFGSQYGVTGEIIFNASGGGASVGIFAKTNDFTFSGGAIAIPDYSKGAIAGFSDTPDTQNSNGLYLGVKYKLLSIRYIRYEVDHTYNASKVTGYTGVPPNQLPIREFGSSNDTLTRDVLWIGAVLPF